MLGIGPRSSCRNWFKKLDILMVQSLYIFSLMMFVVNNMGNFHASSSICCMNMKHKNQLHIPLVKYSSIQNGVTFSSIKIFNTLLASIFQLQKDKLIFRSVLRKCLVLHTFYSIEEFLSND
jgi:hypothetical protein